MRLMLTSLIAATLAVSTLTAQAARIPADCNRACLEALINQYLDAVVAHEPKRLPLAADVKYTENEQVLDVGDGFWKNATGRGRYNHYFADPVTGQAAWMGTMTEKAGTLLMALRLRAQTGRLIEIESAFSGPAAVDRTTSRRWTHSERPRRSGGSRFRRRNARRGSS